MDLPQKTRETTKLGTLVEPSNLGGTFRGTFWETFTMAEDPKAIAVGEKLGRYWDQSSFFWTMGSYPITGLCSKRSPWSSTTTLAGGASGGASWQFQEPDQRPKDFGHDGHNTAVNPASVQRQFIPCLSHVSPTSNRGSSGSSYIFSLCRLGSRSTESLSIIVFFSFFFPFLP